MIIVLEARLFEDHLHDLELMAILWLALSREHWLRIEPLWQPGDGGSIGKWFENHGSSIEEVAEFLLGDLMSMLTHPPRTTILVGPIGSSSGGQWPDLQLPIDKACTTIATPLSVIVEDRRTDRDFLLAVAPGRRRESIERAIRQSKLVLENGGGVENMLHRVREIDKNGAPRAFVVSDSDDKGSGPSDSVRELAKECEKWKSEGLAYHQFRRRTIENYLPLRVLGTWKIAHSERAALVDAFCNDLSAEQRCHYNMKIGFSRDQAKGSRLFAEIPPSTAECLRNGFGRKLMAQVLYDEEIPIEDDDLRREGTLQEFEELVDSLLAHL